MNDNEFLTLEKDLISIHKKRVRYYVYIVSVLPIVIITFVVLFFSLSCLENKHNDAVGTLATSIINEKKTFLRDTINITIGMIESIKKDTKQENESKKLTQEQLDAISIKKIANLIRNIRFTDDNSYIWVNRIVNYEGGDNYAIREIHPNLPDTEGEWLSTNRVDLVGNRPYEVELNGIKKDGELFFNYYFKKLATDKVAHKLSYAKLYKPYNWIIATGLYLDDVDQLIDEKNHQMEITLNHYKNRLFIIMIIIIFILLIFIILFEKHFSRLILTYESKINEYTDRLKILSTTDKLTGLNNRLKLDEIFAYEMEKSKRYNQLFSIIMIDLDKFKNINDTYGHQVGDSVLQELAEILQKNIRAVDVVGRWGGEEFLIICTKTDLEGVKKLAENIRLHICSHDFSEVHKVTASFGVSTIRKDDTVESIMKRVDQALYLAKEKGRNRVEEAQ